MKGIGRAARLGATCLTSVATLCAQPGDGRLASVALANGWAGPFDDPPAVVSADGAHVAFTSYAQLSTSDSNAMADVYVLHVTSGRITHESGTADGRRANGDSLTPGIDGDGRYVVFSSTAEGLVPEDDPSRARHVYLRDRHRGETLRLTPVRGGTPLDAASSPAISADGSTVVFESSATNLVSTPAPADPVDVYLARLANGDLDRAARQARTLATLERVSVTSAGQPGRGQSGSPEVSGDGRYVVFMSLADLTTPPDVPDRNGLPDVYVRDTLSQTTTRVSIGLTGGAANGRSHHPDISADGRFVAFVSDATNLVPGRGPRLRHVYLHDRHSGRTERISRGGSGEPADGHSARPSISDDGAFVVFQSLASNLGCESPRCTSKERDANLVWDVFRYERATRGTLRLSGDACGTWTRGGRSPAVDARGDVVVLASRQARNEADEADDEDLFIWRAADARRPVGPCP